MSDVGHKVRVWIKKDTLIRSLVVLALIVLVIGEMTVLIRDFTATQLNGGLRPHEVSERHIEPWMTFNYINILFNLPADYLRETLDIDNARYPNLEIRKYAKDISIDPSLLIRRITFAIESYGEQ